MLYPGPNVVTFDIACGGKKKVPFLLVLVQLEENP
jgi:hypothetical protein